MRKFLFVPNRALTTTQRNSPTHVLFREPVSLLKSHNIMVEMSFWEVSYESMSNRKTVLFQLYPAWVTAQESCKPAGLYITHRQLVAWRITTYVILGRDLVNHGSFRNFLYILLTFWVSRSLPPGGNGSVHRNGWIAPSSRSISCHLHPNRILFCISS